MTIGYLPTYSSEFISKFLTYEKLSECDFFVYSFIQDYLFIHLSIFIPNVSLSFLVRKIFILSISIFILVNFYCLDDSELRYQGHYRVPWGFTWLFEELF